MDATAAAAQELLDELESSRLEVILVPQRIHTNEGGCVRVAISKNVRWYRAFCAAYTARRFKKNAKGVKVPYQRKNAAHDTLIKRSQVVNTLRAIAAGRPAPSCYGYRLAPLVEVRAAQIRAAGVEIQNPF
jgi:hypothetical protein